MDIAELTQAFEFADTVTVERDESGQIDLKMPQHRYKKADDTPVHRYGWGPFCKFYVDSAPYRKTPGVYVFTANHQIVYVGEATDIHGRIQAGYSNISPKNCFEGGQQTNCRINTAILNVIRNQGQVALWATKTADRKQHETELIKQCNPPWNLTAPSSTPPSEQQASPAGASTSHQTASQRDSQPSTPYSADSKYTPLYDYLQTTDTAPIQFTFEEIEDILEAQLPPSARNYRVWWNPAGHSHAEGWAALGWKATPQLTDKTATFEKRH